MSKVAFLFPGQGAQTVGMGRPLFDTLPAARKLFEEANQVLGYDLAAVCFQGPAEKLNTTNVCQPGLFVCSLAALESLKTQSPEIVAGCAGAAGLSLGEYTALAFAGALSFADGLRLVQKRGEAMQAAATATPSGMISILTLEPAKVQEIVNQARTVGTIDIANLLCPGNTVVSGTKAACDRAEKLAQAAGGTAIRLAVAGAFHTSIMKPADEKLAAALQGVALNPPRIPVWSNVDARPHTDPAEIRQLLVQQVLRPVQWEQTVRSLLADGFDRFYEIGPGRVLAGLLKRILRKAECQNISC